MTDLTRRQMEGLNNIKYASQSYVLGIDEVGLGAWAGPVYVAGVVLPKDWKNPFIKDSKRMSESARKAAVPIIQRDARFICVLSATAFDIDRVTIKEVMARLVTDVVTTCLLEEPNAYVVMDGDTSPLDSNELRHAVFPKADDLVPAVSAASIIAKVERDSKMVGYGSEYPGFGFEKHKGYGTKEHQTALDQLGLCPLHRRSYAPIKRIALAAQG